jgi:hypothetical protein
MMAQERWTDCTRPTRARVRAGKKADARLCLLVGALIQRHIVAGR